MPRAYVAAAAVLVAFAWSGYALAQPHTTAPAPSPLELRITGPRLIHRGDRLNFAGVIVNRSTHPVAFALRQGGWDCDGVFRWKITDTGDRRLPPMLRQPVGGMICCLTSGVSEDELIVLQPGETYDLTDLSDPSDDFVFPGKGFYRVTLRLIYRPESVEDGRKPEEIAKPESKWDLAIKTGGVNVTSNTWNVYLNE